MSKIKFPVPFNESIVNCIVLKEYDNTSMSIQNWNPLIKGSNDNHLAPF